MLPSETTETSPLGGVYRAVPLYRRDKTTPLRLCVVVQDNAEAVGGPFVLLRDLADASVYLGCIIDAGLTVREWIEIWVQNLENFGNSFPAYRQSATNAVLDERWSTRADAFREIEPESFVVTGWESAHPNPIFFDLNLNAMVSPADKATKEAWELCTDRFILRSKGLPDYSTSLARYLYLPKSDTARFIPVTTGAPENEGTQPLAEALGNLLPLNPSGGLMMVRTFSPIGYEDWIGLLAGKAWSGVEHGKKAIKPTGIYRTLQDANAIQQGGGHLFMGNQGRAGRIAESFHLRLHLLASALRLVRAHVQAHKLPFLNLSPASFRLRLSDSDSALPYLWNFKVSLVVPGEAAALEIATTDARYFIPARFGETSIYRPATLSLPIDSRGGVRIRKVIVSSGSDVSIEGTLSTQERFSIAGSDLLWLRLTLPSGRVDLYANLDANETAVPGEVRFRSVPQRLNEATVFALRQAEGVQFPAVPFQTLPLLSTPCDLYAMGVLALRTLLVDEEVSLPIALDEMFSLARQVAADTDTPPGQRVAAIMAADASRARLLGPHRLSQEEIAPDEAARIFPAELWWDTLALILRFFPGLGPDSLCRDYGDAPPLALESIFDEPLAELEKLIMRSRSLVVIDWNANREVGSVIRQILNRHGG